MLWFEDRLTWFSKCSSKGRGSTVCNLCILVLSRLESLTFGLHWFWVVSFSFPLKLESKHFIVLYCWVDAEGDTAPESVGLWKNWELLVLLGVFSCGLVELTC